MPASDYLATASDDAFAGRVLVSCFKVAGDVVAEAGTVPQHAERISYVKRVARGDDRPRLIGIHMIMASAAIRTAIDAAPALKGSNVTDAQIETALAAIWTPRALAFA